MNKIGQTALSVLAAALLGASSSATTEVSCDKEDRGALQQAIDAARPGDTIAVIGTCEANLKFSESRNRITIDGGGKAVIRGPDLDDFTQPSAKSASVPSTKRKPESRRSRSRWMQSRAT